MALSCASTFACSFLPRRSGALATPVRFMWRQTSSSGFSSGAVDRTHVLATSHMDRHAAYVGLSRHRERVDLHSGADDLGSRERLARALGRERPKDTSLDYGLAEGTRAEPETRGESVSDSARACAERRGLPLESEIVLRERPAAQHVAPARPRRGCSPG
jgi:hypothetical protein